MARCAAGRWRTLCFLSGVAVVLVALQSGVDAYDDRLLSAHMVQHLLLLMVAPPLLLLGRRWLLALRALPAGRGEALARVCSRARAELTRPAVCLAVFAAVIVGFPTCPLYDATLRHPLLHDLEHAAFLFRGPVPWWPLLDADPVASRRLGGLGRILYMLVAMPPMALIGAYLNRANTVVYAPYAASAHALGISAVLDQQHAGAIMWVARRLLHGRRRTLLGDGNDGAEERRSSAAMTRRSPSATHTRMRLRPRSQPRLRSPPM